MKIKSLPKIPNDGYTVSANWSCVIENKILFGGGSGFIQPLAKGGIKQLSNCIRLLDLKNNKWIVLDQYKVKLNNKDYGFCNGVSLKLSETKTAFVGGIKQINGQISNSSDILICELKNNKLKLIIYQNVLPFSGEMVGAINDQKIACILGSDNKVVLIDFKKSNNKNPFTISKEIFANNLNISGAQVTWDSLNKKWAFLGGYVGFNKTDHLNSNYFNLNQLIFLNQNNFESDKMENFKTNPLTYLGASSFLDENLNGLLLVGGVNKTKFIKAVYNLSTLENEKLTKFKSLYFNYPPKYFNFNKQLVLINLKQKSLKKLGLLPCGLAGNPSFVKWKESFYILSGETKPGVRLLNPWKMDFN